MYSNLNVFSISSYLILSRRRLEIGQLYAIAGNSQKVGLCQYIKEYSLMTQVEKRGIAGAYKKGCTCDVSRFAEWRMYEFTFQDIIMCLISSTD